jgi:hypothetical protein
VRCNAKAQCRVKAVQRQLSGATQRWERQRSEAVQGRAARNAEESWRCCAPPCVEKMMNAVSCHAETGSWCKEWLRAAAHEWRQHAGRQQVSRRDSAKRKTINYRRSCNMRRGGAAREGASRKPPQGALDYRSPHPSRRVRSWGWEERGRLSAATRLAGRRRAGASAESTRRSGNG